MTKIRSFLAIKWLTLGIFGSRGKLVNTIIVAKLNNNSIRYENKGKVTCKEK